MTPSDKYKILKELINALLETEIENYNEAKEFGVDCAGACMAIGAIDAYKQVLSDITDLEREVIT